MGHSSIAVTMNVYTHAPDEMQEDAADRVREFLFGAEN
jgi:integrase